MDSAAGSAKEARDRNTQAILPIRGKILNVLKADLHKAMGNEEIKSMITAFGLEIKENKIVLNEDKFFVLTFEPPHIHLLDYEGNVFEKLLPLILEYDY